MSEFANQNPGYLFHIICVICWMIAEVVGNVTRHASARAKQSVKFASGRIEVKVPPGSGTTPLEQEDAR